MIVVKLILAVLGFLFLCAGIALKAGRRIVHRLGKTEDGTEEKIEKASLISFGIGMVFIVVYFILMQAQKFV